VTLISLSVSLKGNYQNCPAQQFYDLLSQKNFNYKLSKGFSHSLEKVCLKKKKYFSTSEFAFMTCFVSAKKKEKHFKKEKEKKVT